MGESVWKEPRPQLFGNTKMIKAEGNVADLLTKHLGTEAFEKHVKQMGYEFRDGRAGEAVSINMCTDRALRAVPGLSHVRCPTCLF